jgi:apolipoprotein N-acyltransferase
LWRKGDLFLLIGSSSLLLSASFPKIGLALFAWFAISPLLFALQQGSALQSAVSGFLFGCLFVIGSFSWALGLSQLNYLTFFIGSIIFSLYFAAFGFFYQILSRNIKTWIIIGAPSLWIALEYLRSNFSFLSWPWNLLGHSQYQCLPIIQIADLTGVYGISFLIIMVNQILSQVPDIPKIKQFLALKKSETINKEEVTIPRESGAKWVISVVTVSVALLLTLSYGWYQLTQPESGNSIPVALVQPNMITRDLMPVADQVKQLQEYGRLTQIAAREKPALIVWPASSLPAPLNTSKLVQESLKRLTHQTGTYLLVGGAGMEKFGPSRESSSPYSNTEFLISPRGEIEKQYHKILLVPFNEYLPLQEIIRWPKWVTTLPQSFISGKEYTLFEISGIKFSSPICWESLFPDFFRRVVLEGANFMVSVTNEGFMGRTSGPYQSLAINVFRAVENRIAIIRSAPTGISAIIHPNGKIAERVQDSQGNDLFVSGILIHQVPLTEKRAFYTFYGDLFACLTSVIAVLMVLISLILRRRNFSR